MESLQSSLDRIGLGNSLGCDESTDDGGMRQAPLSVHETRRIQKGIESNARSIENRIKFFKREEEKIWQDLEEVRRQAAKIEDGRSRTLEKKLADKSISQVKDDLLTENQKRVMQHRQMASSARQKNVDDTAHSRRQAGEQQRKETKELVRRKKSEEVQLRLQKSEKIVYVQQAQLEAKLRANKERGEKLAQLRSVQEQERFEAEREIQQTESRLPELEAQEMLCLQRLQNSRVITQTVLQELEVSLGSCSAVTSLLRSKAQRGSQYGLESSQASASVLSPLEETEFESRPFPAADLPASYAAIQNSGQFGLAAGGLADPRQSELDRALIEQFQQRVLQPM